MKFEKITDNKIKIIFTVEDMNINNVSVEGFLSNKILSEKVLQSIISEAEKQVGFNTENHELLVEALSTSDGGLEFTITKLFIDNDIEEKDKFLFKFTNFDDFLKLCTYIKNMNNLDIKQFITTSSLFFYKNYYYLVINYDSLPNSLFYILNEFSYFIPYASGIEGIINEYGKIVFSNNAIEDCINIFITKKDIV